MLPLTGCFTAAGVSRLSRLGDHCCEMNALAEDRHAVTMRLALRRGSNGFVQLAQHVPTEQLVAIKFLRRGGSTDPRLIAREVRILWVYVPICNSELISAGPGRCNGAPGVFTHGPPGRQSRSHRVGQNGHALACAQLLNQRECAPHPFIIQLKVCPCCRPSALMARSAHKPLRLDHAFAPACWRYGGEDPGH